MESSAGLQIHVPAKPPTPRGDFYVAYWTLAAERQRVFEARLRGEPGPWTADSILRRYKFCNSFRASDRVSQYLIQRVIHGTANANVRDTIFRTILFRLFSRPSTWELIESEADSVRLRTFDAEWIAATLDKALESGQRLYTSAFILSAQDVYGHKRKHRNHLALVEAMVHDRLPDRVAEAKGLREIYDALLRFPLIGPFIGYQMAVDINYCPQFGFSENEVAMFGPGSTRGLAKVFRDLGGYTPEAAVTWLVEQQDRVAESIGVRPPTLFGRRLHVTDCLNLLCELDRYARVAIREAAAVGERCATRTFVPAPAPPSLFYPPAWGINERIPVEARAVPPGLDPRVTIASAALG